MGKKLGKDECQNNRISAKKLMRKDTQPLHCNTTSPTKDVDADQGVDGSINFISEERNKSNILNPKSSVITILRRMKHTFYIQTDNVNLVSEYLKVIKMI